MKTASERVFNAAGEEVGKKTYEFEEQMHIATTNSSDSISIPINSESSRIFVWSKDTGDKSEVLVEEKLGTLTDEAEQDGSLPTYYKLSGSWPTDVLNTNIPLKIVDGEDEYLGITKDDVGTTKIEAAQGIADTATVWAYNQTVSDNLYLSVPIVGTDTSEPLSVNIFNNTNNSRINIMLVSEV